jgi:hypothetical protein
MSEPTCTPLACHRPASPARSGRARSSYPGRWKSPPPVPLTPAPRARLLLGTLVGCEASERPFEDVDCGSSGSDLGLAEVSAPLELHAAELAAVPVAPVLAWVLDHVGTPALGELP